MSLLSLAVIVALTSALFAQQGASAGKPASSLPDTPQPQQNTAATFIGYATNRSLLFPDIATSPGPLSTGGKFKLFVNESISPAYILASSVSAAVGQARDVPPGFGQGWNSYGSRFGTNLARNSSSSFFGPFLAASVLHQDPRFFPQSRPSIWGSLKYSVQRLILTRNDSGTNVFNSSGLLGPLAAETLANAYLPVQEQTGAKTMERFGVDLAWQVGANMFKNYWPTFFHSMGLNRLKVIPDPGQAAR